MYTSTHEYSSVIRMLKTFKVFGFTKLSAFTGTLYLGVYSADDLWLAQLTNAFIAQIFLLLEFQCENYAFLILHILSLNKESSTGHFMSFLLSTAFP